MLVASTIAKMIAGHWRKQPARRFTTVSSYVVLCGPLPHPPVFHQVLILKGVEVVCFDTLLQVLILKEVTAVILMHFCKY